MTGHEPSSFMIVKGSLRFLAGGLKSSRSWGFSANARIRLNPLPHLEFGAYAIIGRLTGALPPGSYLTLNHPTLEVTGEKMAQAIEYWNQYGKPPGRHRTPAEIARFFDGLELVEPGLVSITRWRPEPASSGEPEEIDQFGAVGRKP